jgi:threonine synthase
VNALNGGAVQEDDFIIVLNTGSGLKDIHAVMRTATSALVIEPTIAALKRVIK